MRQNNLFFVFLLIVVLIGGGVAEAQFDRYGSGRFSGLYLGMLRSLTDKLASSGVCSSISNCLTILNEKSDSIVDLLRTENVRPVGPVSPRVLKPKTPSVGSGSARRYNLLFPLVQPVGPVGIGVVRECGNDYNRCAGNCATVVAISECLAACFETLKQCNRDLNPPSLTPVEF